MTYEYECTTCKTFFEAEHGIKDPPITRCSTCGKETVRRLISSANFVLQGKGWFKSGGY